MAIKTATPLQLVVILYQAAIDSLQDAREQIDRGNIAGRSRSINKSIAIISELQACLNLREGGEIARSLDRLYDYMKYRIFRANVEQSTKPLSEIEALLENLCSAWMQLVVQTQGAGSQPSNSDASRPRVLDAETLPAVQTKSIRVSG